MKQVMIDFETLGTSKNACVVQVGAAFFDIETGKIGDTFKRNIDPRDAVKNGAVIDADTVCWWLAQSDAARASIMKIAEASERDTFLSLNSFLSKADEIWSHATFDFVILTEALKRLDIKPNFSYRAARDIRTLSALSKLPVTSKPRGGVHHDALDDCLFQIEYCSDAYAVLRGKSIPARALQ